MTNTIQVRRGANASLPTLNAGEPGFSTDTKQVYIGDGVANHEIFVDSIAVADLANGTDGELITWDAAGVAAVVAAGTADQVLTSNGAGAAPTFKANAAGFADPMTTRGDVIVRNASNVTDRLAIGASSYVLTSDGTDIAWAAGGSGSSTVNVWLPAEAAYLPATNPAQLIEEAGATVYGGFSYGAFDDTTAESMIWRVPVPDYDGGNIIVTAFSKVAATPAGAVTGIYDILTIGLATSEAFDAAVTVDTTVNISHSLNTTELLTDIMVASGTIDPANVAADDLLVIQLKRDVATDTLVGDLELVGIYLSYSRN